MGTPFPDPPFLQSGVFRLQRALIPCKRMFPARKDSFIYGNATSESEFGQEIQGRCKIERGPQIFTEYQGFFYHFYSVASEPVEKWDGSTASASPPLPSPPLPRSGPPSTKLGGLGERCKLPQWGLNFEFGAY